MCLRFARTAATTSWQSLNLTDSVHTYTLSQEHSRLIDYSSSIYRDTDLSVPLQRATRQQFLVSWCVCSVVRQCYTNVEQVHKRRTIANKTSTRVKSLVTPHSFFPLALAPDTKTCSHDPRVSFEELKLSSGSILSPCQYKASLGRMRDLHWMGCSCL